MNPIHARIVHRARLVKRPSARQLRETLEAATMQHITAWLNLVCALLAIAFVLLGLHVR